MRIITVSNQKGGLAKSTTATSLAALFGERGRTLLIDADPQGNSTDTFRAQTQGRATLFDVILDEEPLKAEEAIQHTDSGDIIAADKLLTRADEVLSKDINGLFRMQDALSELVGYDYIVIDTAPAMNTLLYNCLIASTDVVIPVTADRYSLQGLAGLSKTIRQIQKRQNPDLAVAGLLRVRYDPRTRLSKEVQTSLEAIAAGLDTKVFTTSIRECVKVREAQVNKQTVIDYAPTCTAAIDYRSFVDELDGICTVAANEI
jgi:chromosome partitioning protein